MAYRIDLSNQDFSGQDLRGRDFSDADLRGANLTSTNCAGVSFARANLAGAELSHADMSYADLTAANLRQVCAQDVKFLGATLRSADLCVGDWTHAIFNLADLIDARFGMTDLTNCEFVLAYLRGCSFRDARLDAATKQSRDAADTFWDGQGPRPDRVTPSPLNTSGHDIAAFHAREERRKAATHKPRVNLTLSPMAVAALEPIANRSSYVSTVLAARAADVARARATLLEAGWTGELVAAAARAASGAATAFDVADRIQRAGIQADAPLAAWAREALLVLGRDLAEGGSPLMGLE